MDKYLVTASPPTETGIMDAVNKAVKLALHGKQTICVYKLDKIVVHKPEDVEIKEANQ